MTKKTTKTRKVLVSLLCVLLVFTMIPTVAAPAYAADFTEVADTSTLDGWKSVFGEPGSNRISTENAGKVWTDKSVFTNSLTSGRTTVRTSKENSMLVALSAMASNTAVKGEANVPTDTMLILDVSGSMNDNAGNNDQAENLVKSANTSIAKLLGMNPNNRVGVILYSGTSASNTNNDAAIVLLPLGRYTTARDNGYLQYTVTGRSSTTETVSIDSDTRIENTTTKPAAASKEVVGATYIQKGLYAARLQFEAVSSTTINDPVLGEVKRTPIIVLMSDGGPTLASTNFTAPGQYNVGNGQTSSISSTTGFLSQLTAAYTKAKVEDKYNTDCKFYTLGFKVGSDNIAMSVMQPANSTSGINNLWNSYNRASVNGYINVGSNKYVQKISTQLEKNYVDGYYSGDTGLQSAFEAIVGEIQLQSRYFPTLVSRDNNLEGYVSFVDKIGEYMHVSDIKGIMIHDKMFTGAEMSKNFVSGGGDLGQSSDPKDLGVEFVKSVQARLGIATEAEAADLIRQAYYAGQMKYVSSTDYSNYVGWYADKSGNYLGFWYEGITTAVPSGATHIVKSYAYLGEVHEEQGVDKSDMMYVTVRHMTEIATGEEQIAFAVPAALLPTLTYEVELDENDDLEGLELTGATSPIRLIYEVALDEDINELTINEIVDEDYRAENKDSNGNVFFYTNKYDKAGNIGYGKVNTYSYFNPSKQNEMYYYTADATVYADDNGTVYNSSSAPSGEKYRAVTVYEKDGNVLRTRPEYIKIASDVLPTATAAGGGTWKIKGGTVHTNLARFVIPKVANETGTLRNVAVPYVDTDGHGVDDSGYSYYIGSTLGNNGRITVSPVTAIKISKEVAVKNTNADAPETFSFIVQGPQGAEKTYDAVFETVDGKLTHTTVNFDSSGKATIELKDGESLYIVGLSAGIEYIISEVETGYYVLTTENNVKVKTKAAEVVSAEFVNTARGEGSLTLTKDVTHNLGQDPESLASKTFTMNVDLDGIGTANAEFDVIDSLEQVTSITTDADGKFSVRLKDNQQMRIIGLPEGTIVKVVESNPGDGFTATYVENGTVDDGTVTIENNAIQSVIISNAYVPQKVDPVNIELDAKKVYTGFTDDWNGKSFQFELQKRVDGVWTTFATKTVTEATTDYTVNFDEAMQSESYTKPGTYEYQIIETHGGSVVDGVTYDATIHTFGVVVTDDDMDGKLEIKDVISFHTGKSFEKNQAGNYQISVEFNNVYHAEGTSAYIDVVKDINDLVNSPLDSKAGFQFGLYDGNKLVSSSDLTDTTGEARLTINYTKDDIGKHTYTLKEIVPKNPVAGMTYTKAEYVVVINVTDNGDGTTSAVVESIKDASGQIVTGSPVFTNVYKPENVTINLENRVEKVIEGRDLVAGEFKFAIKDVVANKVVAEGTNNEAGYVTFDGGNKLTFDKVGTYRYDVYEVTGDGNGVTSDKTVFNVIVTVTDGGNGKLSVTYLVTNLVSDEHITFRNVYDPVDAKWSISGKKTLEGKQLIDNEFHFKMEETNENGNAVDGGKSWTVSNESDGSFKFPQITYDKSGTYYYLITELDDSFAYITHDQTEYLVKVTVADDLKGELTATHTILQGTETVSEVSFENVYTPNPAKLVLGGTKVLENKPLTANAYGFELYNSNESWQIGEKIGQTVYNQSNGKFNFNEIQYDKAGSYYYIVKEAIPVDANDNVKDGITYDTAVYRIRVDVRDNFMGQLSAVANVFDSENVPSEVLFTNTYKTTPAEVDLEFTKILTGRNMEAGEFTYHLVVEGGQNDGELVAEVTNGQAAEGTPAVMTIENLKFSEAGTYNYRLVEVIPSNAVNGFLDGVQYDNTVYEIEVVVTDNGQGEMNALTTVDGVALADAEMTFTNVYTAQPAKLTLEGVKKILSGRDMQAGEPTFKFLLEDNVTGVVTKGETKTLGTDGQQIAVVFDDITYTQKGTYTYTLSELTGTKGGMTYSADKYIVTVVVTDDADGQLVAGTPSFQKVDSEGRPTGSVQDSVVYTNLYNADEVKVTLEGTKTLLGKELTAGMFSFVLEPAANASGETVKNGTVSGGTVRDFQFEELTFNQEGTYNYTVREVVPADLVDGEKDGITYDTSVIDVTIVVEDDLNGQLKAKITYTENGLDVGGIEFTNDYNVKPVDVEIEAQKTLTGGILEADEFTFELYEGSKLIGTAKNDADGKVVFDKITYNEIGEYTYTVKEKAGSDLTINYDTDKETVVVTVTDDGKGNLKAVVNGRNPEAQTPVQFENIDPQDVSVTIDFVKKILTGRDAAAGEFTFDLEYVNGPSGVTPKATWNQIGTNAAANDGDVAVVTFPHQLVFDAEGIYVFNLVEVNKGQNINNTKYDDSTYKITVTVTDDGTKLNAAYKIEEIVGGEPVTDTDNIVVFENVYTPTPAEGNFILNVNKSLAGRDMDANEFVFNLTGEGISIQGKNIAGKDGESVEVQFPDIKYTQKGTYTYTLTEVNNNISGVTYDGDSYEVTINVTDDGKGKLTVEKPVFKLNGSGTSLDKAVFENTYKAAPAEVNLKATKTLSFKDLTKDMFEFKLTLVSAPEDANMTTGVVQTVGNGTDSRVEDIVFEKIALPVTGEYVFKVSEVDGGKRIKGITYDDTEYTVTVKVTDPGDGQLDSEVKVDGIAAKEMTFENIYTADAAKVILKAQKTLKGGNLGANQFSFELYKAGELTAKQTKTNAANGLVTFDEIEFDQAGQYVYIIKEVLGSDSTINYDTTEHRVTVDVTDNGEGKLVAKIGGVDAADAEPVSIENVDPTDAVVAVDFVTKVLEGRAMSAGEFEFELKLIEKPSKAVAKDNWNQTVKNVAAADRTRVAVGFAGLVFDVEGNYVFEITEKPGDLGGVTYDGAKYRVYITVTDNGTALSAEVDLKEVVGEREVDVETAAFENKYEAAPYTVDFLTALEKQLEGRELAAGEFAFKLVNVARPGSIADDDIKADWLWTQTVINKADDADGTMDGIADIDFAAVTLPVAGDYIFEVSEVNSGRGGIDYSEDVFVYKMTVVDSGNGKLVLDGSGVKCELKNGTYKDQIFKNTYEASEAVYVLEGAKTLYGTELKADMFAFNLYAADVSNGVWTRGDLLETVKNDADGKFAFEEQIFTTTGTHYFMVVEDGSNPVEGMIYDNTVYLVQVDVTDNGEGQLIAEETLQKQSTNTVVPEVVFNNTYVAHIPKTGDANNAGLWTAILALCASGFAGLIFLKKKDEEDKE